MREIETSQLVNTIAGQRFLLYAFLQLSYSIGSIWNLPVIKILRVEIDNEGNPMYFTTYEEWLKYVRTSDLEEIVLPEVKTLELEKVLKDLNWEYKLEIKHNLTPVDPEVIIIYLNDCSLVKRAEYIVLAFTLINGVGKEIVPVCGEFTMEKYKDHLFQQLYWLSK
ncbi:hypothetical protein [Sulfurisphaera tokodaii]|uniref:hypothetical protein n=1 Tax=Sulfurisphaera tokodaii TaxID=111955 RepID=UPI000A491D35|nr:hypothetical protein [Sulfurisphaera tokodaii]